MPALISLDGSTNNPTRGRAILLPSDIGWRNFEDNSFSDHFDVHISDEPSETDCVRSERLKRRQRWIIRTALLIAVTSVIVLVVF